mgnify:CR=1 FL=1
MALDPANYPSELVITDPAGGEPVGQADDQIRTAKRALNQGFPNVSGACTATHTQLNETITLTANLALKANIASPTFTGTVSVNNIDMSNDLSMSAGSVITANGFNINDQELSYLNNASSNIQDQLDLKGTMTSFLWDAPGSSPLTINQGDTIGIDSGNGIDVSRFGGIITIAGEAASTTNAGIVQLSTSVTGTSETLAATPSAVKEAYDVRTFARTVIYSGSNVTTRSLGDISGYDMIVIESNYSTQGNYFPHTFMVDDIVINRTYTWPADEDGSDNNLGRIRFTGSLAAATIAEVAGFSNYGFVKVVGVVC